MDEVKEDPVCSGCIGDDEQSPLGNPYYLLQDNSCWIKNCSYKTDHLCLECDEGYVSSQDHRRCVLQHVEHCQLYNDEGEHCIKCQENYALLYHAGVNKTECQENSQKNCEKVYSDFSGEGYFEVL